MAPIEEVLYTGPVILNDFQQFVQDCDFSSGAFVLVERLPEQVVSGAKARQDLVRFSHFEQDFPFAHYTSGRVFDEQAELRWERQGGMMRVVYFGSNRRTHVLLNYKLQANNKLDELKPGEEKEYFLFGERLEPEDVRRIGPPAQLGDFAEVRIPRLLRYPPVGQDNQPFLQLVVREYLDTENRVMLFRFQNLKPGSRKQ